MGCLFGYCGLKKEGLLERMAKIMDHRCHNGWERASMKIRDGYMIEIGHGIAPFNTGPRILCNPERRFSFGISGVLYNSRDIFYNEEYKSAFSTTFDIFSEPDVVGGFCGSADYNDAVRTYFKTAVFSNDLKSGYTGKGVLEKISEEKLFEAFKGNPEKWLEGLEGAFVSALFHNDSFYITRDPSGIKVIYWTIAGGRFLFASEIKALLADSEVKRRMRPGALLEYLTFSFVPGEKTMIDDIYELQPGTILKFSQNETISINRHFQFENFEYADDSDFDVNDHVRKLKDDFIASVNECCKVTQKPPAIFVSGGIDSSSVLAQAAHHFPGLSLKTYSIHFGSKYANENEFVRMMIDRYRTDHHWIEINPSRFINRMEKIIWQLDDPIGDPITVPNYLMAEEASKSALTALNGEGGDPCFGGPKNIPMFLSKLYGSLPGEKPNNWLETHYLLSYKKCFNELDKLLNPEIIKESGGQDALADIIKPFFNSDAPKSYLNRLMNINIRLKGSNLILVKVDKMTSANGILALPPLFSKRIIQRSMACPPGLKLSGNIEKNILKKAVSDIVPKPIIDRPKSGMMVPVRFWFMKEMKRFAKQTLSKKNIEPLDYFNVNFIQQLLKYDKKEIYSSKYGLKIWMLITFVLWHKQIVEQNGNI